MRNVRQMAKVLRFFPFFTVLGLMTIALFFLVEGMGPGTRETALGQSLIVVLRVVIIPLWLMRILIVMVGGVLFGFGRDSFPIWYEILNIPVILLPYLLADLVLHGWWRNIPCYKWISLRS